MWERRRAVRGGLMVKVLIVENEGLFGVYTQYGDR